MLRPGGEPRCLFLVQGIGKAPELTAPYLELLDHYGIPWTELVTASPGRIAHEDEVQVVAVPWTHHQDWPFSPEPALQAGPGLLQD